MTAAAPVVVKVGGETLRDPADRARLAFDLAGVAASQPRLCVLHGAGPQITFLAKRLGLESVFKGGRRVTDAPMRDAVAMAMCGEVATALLGALLGAGVRAVATPAASARIALGKRRPPRRVAGESEPVDFGLVADVLRVDTEPLLALWRAGLVPVLSPLVADAGGELLNLNADALCTALVRALGPCEVVLVTGVAGVYRDLADPASHLPALAARDIAALIAAGSVQGGMIAKLEEVAAILAHGAKRVHIVGFAEAGAIGAALSGAPGLRTTITADDQ